MTGVAAALDSATVMARLAVPLLPSVTLASLIDMLGAVSSLTMVPVATARDSVAPVGLDSVTVTVSLGSTVVSPSTPTLMVWVVWPAAKVRVPELAV